ncbi:MAG TPA: hypothetical protein VF916_14870 [Ktedonobacterales bacterium]
MTSTKVMLLGILIMVSGLALDSAIVHFVTVRAMGFDAADNLAYIAAAVFVVGFIVGVVGFFRR